MPVIWDGSIASSFNGGNGLANDPFIITTGNQLAYLSQSISLGNSYSNSYFSLSDDIYLNDVSSWQTWNKVIHPNNTWVVAGTYHFPFNGIFNGNNHTIYGMYICSEDVDCIGLFSHIFLGQILNLGIQSSYVQGKSYVGSVCGYNSFGVIESCSSNSVVLAENYCGGISGCNRAGTITNCYNSGSISATNTYAGGISGGNNGTIRNCFNSGPINSLKSGAGISSINCRNILNCYNKGEIQSGNHIGGLSSLNYGDNYPSDLFRCYNSNQVSSASIVHAGSIVGKNKGKVESCYYLEGTCPNATAEYGTELSAIEMKAESSFVKWGKFVSTADVEINENNVWEFPTGLDPNLYWE